MAADHPEIARQAHGVAEAHAEAHEGAHDHAHHPDWRTYKWVALILTVITIVEVWVYYTPFVEHRLFVPSLLAMSAAKFIIVVMFYMHLKYDHKLFREGLGINTGIYGSVFFTLTGMHGLHVTGGVITLFVVALRAAMGHFSAHNHFAVEGTVLYWHFVDVVWILLYATLYLL